jgi:hypothetical protein
MLAAAVNIARILLVLRHMVGAQQLGLQHLGKADDGIQRGPQFMAHRR